MVKRLFQLTVRPEPLQGSRRLSSHLENLEFGTQMRVTMVIAVCLSLLGPSLAAEQSVVDGNTLRLDGRTFRLAGIEAPATDQTCLDHTGAIWRCGIEARDRLKAFVGSRTLICNDVGADPIYRKRRIGTCSMDGEKTSINQWLVREGWALNIDPKSRYKEEEYLARRAKKGLWNGCFVSPQVLRRWSRTMAKLLGAACPADSDWQTLTTLFPDRPSMPAGCSIKGKLAARALVSGHRGVYHMESCGSYRRTTNPERWFCSEDEAKAEGFRKALTC
jgi:endonuclease YncB( thermonuclease family)